MLQALGLKSAFDQPRGSANFDRMAPRKPDEYLYLAEAYHKVFLVLDETGTEAAAASMLNVKNSGALSQTQPFVVKVDRPFLFAIQERESGVCLFLGRVTDPR